MATIDNSNYLSEFKAHLVETGLSPATVVNYLADLRGFLRWIEKRQDAAVSPLRLGTQQIQEYCAYLKDSRGHAAATVNRRLQALRKFYGFAAERAWTAGNPANEVSLLSETVSPRSRFLTPADVDRLLRAVRAGRRRWAERDWAIIQVFLGAGLKLRELTHLLLSDVHLEGEEPLLDVRGSSGEADRTIPLQAEVSEALRAYAAARRARPGVRHLFVNRDGRPLSTRSVQRLLRHYARAAHLSELTTQALRYRYARTTYESSHDAEVVARLLGHRHLATTIRFLRPSPGSPGSPDTPLPGTDTPD